MLTIISTPLLQLAGPLKQNVDQVFRQALTYQSSTRSHQPYSYTFTLTMLIRHWRQARVSARVRRGQLVVPERQLGRTPTRAAVLALLPA